MKKRNEMRTLHQIAAKNLERDLAAVQLRLRDFAKLTNSREIEMQAQKFDKMRRHVGQHMHKDDKEQEV